MFEHAASLLLASSALKHFVRLRDRDPWVMIQRLERSRALISSHGEWRVHGRRGDAIIEVRDELVWLDSAWTTAIASIFPALELPRAEVTCSLQGPFDGTIRVRW